MHVNYNRSRHSVHSLHVHLVFVTKYRHRVLTNEHLTELQGIFTAVTRSLDVELIEMNGEPDHVHLLVHIPPTLAVAELVNQLKGNSSRRMRQHRHDLTSHYRRFHGLWSASYFASSAGGAPLDAIKKYIQNQRRPS